MLPSAAEGSSSRDARVETLPPMKRKVEAMLVMLTHVNPSRTCENKQIVTEKITWKDKSSEMVLLPFSDRWTGRIIGPPTARQPRLHSACRGCGGDVEIRESLSEVGSKIRNVVELGPRGRCRR
jgi:hypothetical protein